MALGSMALVGAAMALLMVPAAPAYATLSNVTPEQGGTLQPGDGTQFSVTTDAFCLRADADSPNYIVTPNLGGVCGLNGERTATILVATTAVTPPGTYTVTVTETGVGAGDEYLWSFTVASADDTTTTTAATTTTTAATTTTTAAPTTTSTTVADVTTTTVSTPATTGGSPDDVGERTVDLTTTTTVAGVDAAPSKTTTTTASTTSTSATRSSDEQADDDHAAGGVEGGEGAEPTPEPAGMPSAELTGLALADFTEPFEPGVTPRFDGVDIWDFVSLFRGDDLEPVASQARPSAAPLVPWATNILIAVMLAQLLTAWGRTPAMEIEGAPTAAG